MRRTSGRYRHWYTVDSRPGADPADVDDAVDRRQIGGERLLAHDVLAGRQGVHDDGLVRRWWRAHDDDVDLGTLDELAMVVRRVRHEARLGGRPASVVVDLGDGHETQSAVQASPVQRRAR